MGLIRDTFPEVIKFLVDESDADIYTHGTVGKVLCRCPICNCEKYVEIHNLCIHGFYCNVCSDGISLPNKWIRNVLNANSVRFISEYHPPYFPKRWSVDVFLPDHNIVIEMDGDYGNHENNENDIYRDKLNLEHGISTIRFNLTDGKYRNKKEILINMTIDLLKDIIPNIENSPWDNIWKTCQKSLVKEVCDYYSKYNCNTLGLSLFFQLNICTIIKYLKLGNELGFCVYNAEDQKANQSKPVIVYDIINDTSMVFKSSSELERKSIETFGVEFTHARELKRSFDNGRIKPYKNRFILKSYNSCND